MRSKLFALTLAVAAVLAVSTGIAAADVVGPDEAQIGDHAEPDEKLTADQAHARDIDDENMTVVSEEYDEKLTDDEAIRIDLSPTEIGADGTVTIELKDD